MHAVFRVLLIFALGVQHELLEDVIIPCDDAAHNKFNQRRPKYSEIKAIGQPLNTPKFKGILVSTDARYLKHEILSASF